RGRTTYYRKRTVVHCVGHKPSDGRRCARWKGIWVERACVRSITPPRRPRRRNKVWTKLRRQLLICHRHRVNLVWHTEKTKLVIQHTGDNRRRRNRHSIRTLLKRRNRQRRIVVHIFDFNDVALVIRQRNFLHKR